MGDGYVRYSSPPVGGAQPQQPLQQQQQHGASASASASGYAPPGGGGGVHTRGYSGQQQPMGYGQQQQNFGWSGVDPATAHMGMQFGKSAVAAGQDYVEKNVRMSGPAHLDLALPPAPDGQDVLFRHQLVCAA